MLPITKEDKIDAVIPAIPKDFSKLPYVLERLHKHMPVRATHIVTTNVDGALESIKDTPADIKVWVHPERNFFSFGPDTFSYRAGITFQALVKLFQDVTLTEWYLVMDADFFIQKPLPIVVNDRPQLFYARDADKVIAQYQRFNELVFGYPRATKSMMNDFALYNKEIGQEICAMFGGLEGLVQKMKEVMGPGVWLAESDTYYAWLHHNHPDLYDLRHISNVCLGKYEGYVYPSQEIKDRLAEVDKNADSVSIHSWEMAVANTGKPH